MKISMYVAMCLLLWVSFFPETVPGVGLDDTFKKATDVLNTVESVRKPAEVTPADSSGTPDTEKSGSEEQSDTNTMGIKAALTKGIEQAVAQVGAENGFYKDEAIKILLPENLRKADSLVRQLGGARLSEALVLKMNRAAEKAAPQALDIFVSAISGMQIDDAMQILSGNETAATDYLKANTSDSLNEAFYPIVKDTMEELGVIRLYNDYRAKTASSPLMQMVDMDINRHVTEKSIDGLFTVVAQEEKNIRRNPAARTTELLQKVFGSLGN